MNDERDLIRLMTWLSPAFPIGAFAYSGGLERAIHDGLVRDGNGLYSWLEGVISHGTLWNDAVLLSESHQGHDDAQRLAEVSELAQALAGSKERHDEIMAQGVAFLMAAGAWTHAVFDRMGEDAPLSVAIGGVAGAHGIKLENTLAAFLHAAASQQVSASIRCGLMGQKESVVILAKLEAPIIDTARRAAVSTLDDLGSATLHADIMSMKHETQPVRLFRS